MKRSEDCVGKRLAVARLRRGLSQATVARLSGIAASYISRIETGRVHPTFRTVQKIAIALRIPLDDLASSNGNPLFRQAGCPVTAGACLLDLIRPESPRRKRERETFTPRQVRLVSSFARWVRDAPKDRQRALEILVEELGRKR